MTLIDEARSHPNEVLVKLSTLVNELTAERDRLRKTLEVFAAVSNWYRATVTFGNGGKLDSVLWGIHGIIPQELAANALEGKK